MGRYDGEMSRHPEAEDSRPGLAEPDDLWDAPLVRDDRDDQDDWDDHGDDFELPDELPVEVPVDDWP